MLSDRLTRMGAVTVFQPSKASPHMNACMRYRHPQAAMEACCVGFRRQVEIGLAHIFTNERDLDTLIFPLLFTWRQYVELRLKLACLTMANLEDEIGQIHKTHDLRWLWARAKRQLLALFPDEPTDGFDQLEAHVDDLAKVDSGSYAFRYAVAVDGNFALPGHVAHIGYVELAATIEASCHLLEGIACHLDSALDFVNARRAEMASW